MDVDRLNTKWKESFDGDDDVNDDNGNDVVDVDDIDDLLSIENLLLFALFSFFFPSSLNSNVIQQETLKTLF